MVSRNDLKMLFFFFFFSLGLCAHRTPDNADKLKKPFVVAYYGVDYVKDPKGTNYWRNRSVIWLHTFIVYLVW